MDITNEYIDNFVESHWDDQEKNGHLIGHGALGDYASARKLLEDFLERFYNLEIHELKMQDVHDQEANACLFQVCRVIERVLKVDMNKPRNKKGELPTALGLMSRKDVENIIRDQVIFDTMNHLRHETGFKKRNKEECAELISASLYRTKGILIDIDNIKKINLRLSKQRDRP